MLTRNLPSDLRLALRTMARQRLFTAAIVLTVAIAVGANTAMFSTVHAALLAPLPFAAPQQLVLGRATFGGNINPFASAPDYYDYRELCAAFSSLAAVLPSGIDATVTGARARRACPSLWSRGTCSAPSVSIRTGAGTSPPTRDSRERPTW